MKKVSNALFFNGLLDPNSRGSWSKLEFRFLNYGREQKMNLDFDSWL